MIQDAASSSEFSRPWRNTHATRQLPMSPPQPLAVSPPRPIVLAKLLAKVPEAAGALAISERKLWELTDPRGPIPCVRIGRSVRYDLRDLRTYIEGQKADGP